jgi:membrane protein DedA with SNARE-associated domain
MASWRIEMGITEFLSQYITLLMEKTGYITVFITMVMESMVLPVPSEAVMPFAGFLIADGKFTFILVVVISTLGSLTGSLISYAIGYYGEKALIHKYGKFLLLDADELEATDRFFNKYGDITIFICRFIPVVRHLISIPAGIAEMNIWKFVLFTVIGAGLWNTFLAFVGFNLRSNWEAVMKYSKVIDVFVLLILALLIAYYIYKHLKKRGKNQA